MAKVYLSPSTQDWNLYAGGLGNEEQWMRDIAIHAAAILREAGHTVKVGGLISAGLNATDANNWGAQYYVAIHTNAGGGVGTEAWYYTGSTLGRKLATSVYNRVAKVSSCADRGVKSSTSYIELNRPKAPSTIIELDFHDRLANAKEIIARHEQYAYAIAAGVTDLIGGTMPDPVPPKPEGATPVWRFRNKKTGCHFYTASEAEKNIVQKDIENWTYEGVAFYAVEV